MSNHRKMLKFVLTIIFCVTIHETSVRSWDIAVAIGREVNFFLSNATLVEEKKLENINDLRGIAYDSVSHAMYLSNHHNIINLFNSHSNEQENQTWMSIFETSHNSDISSLAFDSSIQTLFWTDRDQHTIMKMKVFPNGTADESIVVYNESHTRPHGVALDTCSKRMYWTTTNSPYGTIEVSDYDGNNRLTLFNESLYFPWGLTIDHREQKLYWSDQYGIKAKIERSNLDGTERTVIFSNQETNKPRYLAVDGDSIYWSNWLDQSIRIVSKNSLNSETSKTMKTYSKFPSQILTRYSVEDTDCTFKNKIIVDESSTLMPRNNEIVVETSTILTEYQMPSNDEPRIQTRLCDNYCLKGGLCKIKENGEPECECAERYSGSRCEYDLCDNYCLNGARCIIRNKTPFCICNNTVGLRCENMLTTFDICLLHCAGRRMLQNISSNKINECKCNRSEEEIIDMHDHFSAPLMSTIMSVVNVVLLIIIIVLGFYVNKLRLRPRIKKRFVVSKGVTPLTSRPQIQENQCEITIENCCNMNICETPCFEPKLRNPRNNIRIDGDKNSLLDNMEENSS